jgi:hypothetical protein
VLSEACEAATFGMNKEDVLDETYRKAGKMDRSKFAIAIDGAAGVSLERAAKQLFHVDETEVDVELYKLNVYGNLHLIAFLSIL